VSIAIDTAGRAVLFAGTTVVISLLGMVLMNLSFVTGLAVSAATVVAATMIASLTLLPALLGFAGGRVEVTRWRGLLGAGVLAVGLVGLGLGAPAVLLAGLGVAAVVIAASFAAAPLRREVPRPAARTLPVTGDLAVNIGFTDYLAERLPYFLAAVLVLSFLLLMVVFRSLLVPLKAVIMNLLSIGAAYGVVVAGFQWGWLGGLLNFEGGPIEPWIPMMLFAIVFGLSMDYEVFLLSRVKEEWQRTGDSRTSVADGLAATARVITAAALIMVFVFGSFLLEDDRVVKLIGVGLATAVLLDATIVRMLLVPTTMELLGDRNWWLPSWLNRLLPHIDVEGGHDTDEPTITPDDDSERVLDRV
jgi:uncharacterized membrane protein YdfJ with MMPL/SSD domain